MSSLLFFALLNFTDWRTADRSSAGISPLPQDEREAVVEILAARAINWRGIFAVHSWIATKEKNAVAYKVYQVIGWRMYRGMPVVSAAEDIPDRKWFGAEPSLIYEARGETAEKIIPQVEELSKSYPYQDFYRIWPGPNSNSLVSYIIRHIPEIPVELPPHAIGKDWIDDGKFFGRSEAKTGYQFSVFGALGLVVGLREGIEINILGMTFGIDFLRPALKLPFIGRLGMMDQ